MSERRLLFLTPHLGFRADAAAIHLETDDVVLRIQPPHADTLATLHQLCAPQWTQEVAIDAVLKARLIEHRALRELPIDSDHPARFIVPFLDLCDSWAGGVFESAFWPRFLSGQSSRAQVFAFIAQLHHRTAGADLHNLAAAQNCGDASIQVLLRQHYEEELGHARILAAGIRRCGAAGEQALAKPPLAATTDFIEFMLHTSISAHAYMGCYGIFHAPGTIKTETDLVQQFDTFAQHYPFASAAFDAVASHARLDYQFGHQEIDAVKWIRSGGLPSAEAMRAMVSGAREAARRLRALFDALALIDHDPPWVTSNLSVSTPSHSPHSDPAETPDRTP